MIEATMDEMENFFHRASGTAHAGPVSITEFLGSFCQKLKIDCVFAIPQPLMELQFRRPLNH
jgi:hypothetical protein